MSMSECQWENEGIWEWENVSVNVRMWEYERMSGWGNVRMLEWENERMW
jgi:hypothetical protein